uniref:F-box domain-containing protein n=1 Tax=Acrobeloides nanus TaxID=290746 RepID=A0A914C5X4_9BILA
MLILKPRKVIDLISDDVVLDVLKFLPGEDLNQAKNFSLRWNSLIKNNISQLARRMFYGRVDINEDGEIDTFF